MIVTVYLYYRTRVSKLNKNIEYLQHYNDCSVTVYKFLVDLILFSNYYYQISHINSDLIEMMRHVLFLHSFRLIVSLNHTQGQLTNLCIHNNEA